MKKLGFLFLAFNLLLAGLPESSNAEERGLSWTQKMKKTGQAFGKVLPFIYDTDKFLDPKNQKEIETAIRGYTHSIHKISETKARNLIGDDPYVVINLKELKSKSRTALNFFTRGKKLYAQQLLKSSSSSCFNCHTRLPRGAVSNFWNAFEVDQMGLTAVEKTYLFIAMREFSKAKTFIENHLNRKSHLAQFIWKMKSLFNCTCL